jgi:hypothetical protein
MRDRLTIILLSSLVLAACAGDTTAPPRALEAEARLAGPEATAIEVRVRDIPAGTAVEQVLLIGPGGQRTAAPELVRSTSETGAGALSRPSIGFGVTGGSASGINPSISLGWSLTGGPGRLSRRVGALIALPDPTGYRANPAAWRIEVRYSDVTGRAEVLSLPAPRPE